MKIEVLNLVKHFGKAKAVDGVSFTFGAGDICGFVGPNGAGKTTAMRIISTMDEPTSGDVLVNGVSVIQNPEQARRMIGFVPDSLPEYNDITVHEYLDFFARAYGLRGKERRKVVEGVEEFTNVVNIRDKVLRALSKGMKQRVSLGRALVHDPGVMILDEPAAGLDPRARVELRELLFLLAERGKAIFISSHILSELSEICTNAVIIERGKILERGSITEITTRNNTCRKVMLRVLSAPDNLQTLLLETPGVRTPNMSQNGAAFDFDGSDEALSALLKDLVDRGCKVIEFKIRQDNLEDIFMKVTKGELS